MPIEFLEDDKPVVKSSKIEFIDEPIQEQPSVEPQNIIGELGRAGAGIRSALQGKGFVEGASRPSEVRKFQDIAIEKSQVFPNVYANMVIGMPASALGMAADIVTNPAEVLTTAIPFTKAGQAIGTAIASSKIGTTIGKATTAEITPIKWVKDIFGGIKRAEKAGEVSKSLIRATAEQEIGAVKGELVKTKKVVDKLNSKYRQQNEAEALSLQKALESAEKTYTTKIQDEAFTKSKEIRSALPDLFKQKSAEYGVGLNKILVENPVTATKAEVIPPIEEALLNHGILGTDDAGKIMVRRSAASGQEKSILDEYLRLRSLPDDATINASELLTSQS